MWLSSSPQTLTSHMKMVSKRKADGAGKKQGLANGSGKFASKGKGKFKSFQDRSKNNGSPGRGFNKNGYGRKPKETSARSHVSQPTMQGQQERESKRVANLDPFELFCAYHLGIGANKDYRPSNINEVAKRFGQDPGMIRQALKEYGMDSASLLDRDFDMALAQLDIQVAPEGVDRVELAKTIYEDFQKAPYKKRDWKKILEEDRKENLKIFGH